MKKMLLCAILLMAAMWLIADEPFVIRDANMIDWDGVRLKTSDDKLLCFWQDTLDGAKRIMAQKFDSFGVALWNGPQTVVSGVVEPRALGVVEASDGGFVLLFGKELASDFREIRLQKISATGQVLWSDDGVLMAPLPGYYTLTPLVPDASGGVFVYWNTFQSSTLVMGQHFNSAGQRLWLDVGLIVMQHTADQRVLDAVPDGAGGSIINVLRYDSHQCRMLRISASGTVVGSDPLMPPANFPDANYRLMQESAGVYMLYSPNGAVNMSLLRIDNTGSILEPLVTHPLPLNYNQLNDLSLLKVPSGGFYYTYYTSDPVQFQACRLDDDLAQMWSSPATVVAADSLEWWGINVETDSAGRLWSLWTRSNYPQAQHQIRAQLISPSGQNLWATDGMLLASECLHAEKGFVSTLGDRATFFWKQAQNKETSLNRQSVSVDGTGQFAQGGMPVIRCMAGFANANAVVPGIGGYFALWTDTRANDLGQLYFQYVDQSMSPMLAANGVPLCTGAGLSERLVSALPMPDGNVAVLFTHFATSQSPGDLILQIIHPDGSMALTQPGLTIAADVGSTEASMGISGGDLYIAWLDYEIVGSEYVAKIIGQRVHDGLPEWGGGGRLIYQREQCVVYYVAVNAAYIMVEYQDYGSDGSAVRVFRVMPNGSPANGWPAFGLEPVSTPSNWVSLANFRGGISDDDLICVFRRFSPEHDGLFAQRFAPFGNRVWGANGVMLDTDHYSRVDTADFGAEVSFGIFRMGSPAMWLQRFSPAGEPLLGDDGAMIYVPGNNNEDVLVRYTNGWYSFFRLGNDNNSNSIIQHQSISPGGNPEFPEAQVICNASFDRYDLRGSSIDNASFLIWSDARKGIYDYENLLTGIYGVRVSSNHTDNPPSEALLPVIPELSNISPNPFNPSTTITFSLPQAAIVDLDIYNIRGQKVSTLYHKAPLAKGSHSIAWIARDAKGQSVASGVYMCVLKTAGGIARRRMVLAK